MSTTTSSKQPYPYSQSPPIDSYVSLLLPNAMKPLAKVVKIESWETVKTMLGGLWAFQQKFMGVNHVS